MGPGYNGDMLDPQAPASVTDAPLDAPAAPAGRPSDVSEAAAAPPVRAQSDHTDPFPAAPAGDGPDPAGLVPPVATAGLPADPDRHAGVTWGWAPVSPAGMDRPRSRPRWRSWSAVLLVSLVAASAASAGTALLLGPRSSPVGDEAAAATAGAAAAATQLVRTGTISSLVEDVAARLSPAVVTISASGASGPGAAGQVVGINTTTAPSAEGIGFAIPIEAARSIVSQAAG